MVARARNRIVAAGDVRLSVLEAGDPAGPTVVFVHGYPDDKDVWLPVLERLAADHHVVAYDVRGAGDSSAPRGPGAYRIPRLASDLEAVCEALGGGPVHLVGHDWGGIQGWEFATSEPIASRLASFTTIAGPSLSHALAAIRASLRAGRLREAWERTRRSWYILPLCLPGGPTIAWRLVLASGRWRLALSRLDRLEVAAGFPAGRVASVGLHGANLYRANIPVRLLRRNHLAPARVPVQLIVPEGDRFISASYYDAAERVAPGLVRRSVPGSHWAQRSHPDTIAGWIREFVAGVDGASQG